MLGRHPDVYKFAALTYSKHYVFFMKSINERR